jgi:hypothetical protein
MPDFRTARGRYAHFDRAIHEGSDQSLPLGLSLIPGTA